MAMSAKGLNKLLEECGELTKECGSLTQVIGKKLAYPEGPHPNNDGDLKERMEDEIADVIAASHFVTERLGLNKERMVARVERKIAKYEAWEKE